MTITCIRTFPTEREALTVQACLEQAFAGRPLTAPITVEYSDFVERWTVKCAACDARALYLKTLEVSPL